jgi:hypothetical protein
MLLDLYHTPAHPARQHWLSVDGSNYSDKDHFLDMGTTQCSLSFAHNKYNACIQIYLYNLISGLAKKNWFKAVVSLCQPKPKGNLTGGLAR